MTITKFWATARLSRVVTDIQAGFAQNPNAEKSGMPQLRTNNVSPTGTLDLSEVKYVTIAQSEYEKYAVRQGDVIFNNTNSIEWVGKTAYFDQDEPFVLSNHMTRIRADADLLDAEFLARYLHALWERGAFRNRAKRWVSQAAIDQIALAQLEIPLPPLTEQRRIVAILRKADELRRLRREAQREAQALLPAVFEEMFGNILTNSMKWQTLKIEQICSLVRGSSPRPQGNPRYFGGLIPRLMVADITRDGMYVTPQIDSLTEEGAAKSRPMTAGNVVMAVSGAPGLPAILAVDACIHDGFVGFQELSKEFKAEYLYSVLIMMEARSASQAVGATFQNLTTDQINRWLIPKPSIELQEQYIARLSRIRNLQSKISDAQQEYESLFSSLLVRAFSGELTMAWRERHLDQLVIEATQRDQLLAERGAVRIQEVRPSALPQISNVPPTITIGGPRDAFLDTLSDEQRQIWQAVQASDDYLNAEAISQSYELPLGRTRQTLELLASAGLLLPVSLWNSEIGDFVAAYRGLRTARDDEGQRGDDAYDDDLALLETQ